MTESATGGVLQEKVFLEISRNSQENTCARVFANKVAGPNSAKETLAQLFSCEFCEISKYILFAEHLWAAASDMSWQFNCTVFYWCY